MYIYKTLFIGLTLYTLYVRMPKQLTYNSTMHKKQIKQPKTNFTNKFT